MRNWLQARIDTEDRKIKPLAERIIKSMASFKEESKLDTAEIEASLEAAFGTGKGGMNRTASSCKQGPLSDLLRYHLILDLILQIFDLA